MKIPRHPHLNLQFSLLMAFSILLATSCTPQYPRQMDPRLEFQYAIGQAKEAKQIQLQSLPDVELKSTDANLGAVLREIAKQAAISVVYPEELEQKPITVDLKGPANIILDNLARRHDMRLILQKNIALIGKPLPDDRSVALVKTTFREASKFLEPHLSETGKVTEADGYALLSDRTDVLLRLVDQVANIVPEVYCVQLLEIQTDQLNSVGITLPKPNNINGFSLSSLYNSQLDYYTKNRGLLNIKSWTSILSEGKPSNGFIGYTKQKTETQITKDDIILTNTSEQQVGWKIQIQITNGNIAGFVKLDDPNESQYEINFTTPKPGLYLIHSSKLHQNVRELGLPSSSYLNQDIIRYLWIRYQPLGSLRESPDTVYPAVSADPPSR